MSFRGKEGKLLRQNSAPAPLEYGGARDRLAAPLSHFLPGYAGSTPASGIPLMHTLPGAFLSLRRRQPISFPRRHRRKDDASPPHFSVADRAARGAVDELGLI